NVAAWQWQVDCDGNIQSGSSVLMSTNGTHVLSHRAQDAGGLWTDWTDTVVKGDKTNPTNNTPGPPPRSASNVSVSITGSDPTSSVALVHWKLDTGAWQAGPSSSLVNVTGEGQHTLITYVEDQAGNPSSQRTDTFGLDSTPPIDHTVVPSGWQYT